MRSQPRSKAASDGSDRPSSKTTQGNIPSIRFVPDAMRKEPLLLSYANELLVGRAGLDVGKAQTTLSQPVLLSHRTLNRTFPLDNGGIPTAAGSLSALSAHSAFSLSANVESDAADDHPHTRCGTFFNDPASLRSRFLNDVVVRKGWA
jgi:hypothetical protein